MDIQVASSDLLLQGCNENLKYSLMCIYTVSLNGMFPDVELMRYRVYTFVILLDNTKSPFCESEPTQPSPVCKSLNFPTYGAKSPGVSPSSTSQRMILS